MPTQQAKSNTNVGQILIDTTRFSGTLSGAKANLQSILEMIDSGIQSIQMLFTNGMGSTVPAGATNFLSVVFTGIFTSDFYTPVTRPCTIQNFRININGTQSATGSLVIRVRVNGVDSAITVTIPAGSPAGQYSDLTHVVSLAAGDSIEYSILNNASVASAPIIRASSELLIPLI